MNNLETALLVIFGLAFVLTFAFVLTNADCSSESERENLAQATKIINEVDSLNKAYPIGTDVIARSKEGYSERKRGKTNSEFYVKVEGKYFGTPMILCEIKFNDGTIETVWKPFIRPV
jgi:hypothetical protein